jgi:predicted RNase H-like HicB family nuclease
MDFGFATVKNTIRAGWKWFLSLFKRDWEVSDYPIAIRENEIDPSYVGTRLKQHRYSAQIVNWWVVSGVGDTRAEALQELEKMFANMKAERAKDRKQLPRPGAHVPIELASRERVDAHAALAEDFIRRVLNLDWAWISDDSSLWDFHSSDDNQELIAKINEVYGVDVSDIESAKLWQILDRIASSRVS